MQLSKMTSLNVNLSKKENQESPGANENIARKLGVAAALLLQTVSPTANAEGTPGEWDFDVGSLFYSESDSRVTAIEPVISATRNYEEGRALNFKLTLDMLTGASPNGATPSDGPQVFTTPSGSSSYSVEANTSPLDDTFKDTRVALSTNWSAPINRDWEYNVGVYGSNEYDYLSLGVNGGVKHYLNNKNTELNLGVSVGSDSIDPVGNAPKPLAEMAHTSSPTFASDFAESKAGSDSKTVLDVMFGVTQVIDRTTVMQFNYGIGMADGYLNDPYKVLSVIDETAGANFGGNLLDVNGNPVYLYEARPDSRLKHSFYWQAKHAFYNGDIGDVSYRFMTDDWGVVSHTLEASYQWRFTQSYIEPFMRYYTQGEADFYKRYLRSSEYNSGNPSLTEASADERLAKMTSYTLGAKYGFPLAGNQASVRVAYYTQSTSGDEGFGKLQSQELYPDMDAVMISFGYSF